MGPYGIYFQKKTVGESTFSNLWAITGLHYSNWTPSSYLTGNTNLNTVTTSGIYHIAQGTNRPSIAPYGILLVLNGQDWITQVYFGNYDDGNGKRFAIRNSTDYGQTWNNWHIY